MVKMRTEPTVSKIFTMCYMFCVFHSPTLHAVVPTLFPIYILPCFLPELLQFVRTAQKSPHVGDMKFKRSGAASAAPLRSLSGCAHGCRNEYNDQSFHWLH